MDDDAGIIEKLKKLR